MNCESAIVCVPASHPAFPGHFPSDPVVPGVVLLSMVVEQAAKHFGACDHPSTWHRIRFIQPVGPDQPFRIKLSGDRQQFKFRIESTAGALIAHGQCRSS
ncbi:MAG: hypothetical protein LC637_10625 [Xanthomonadaceae bacterium]|nr:hypothetical protein [Xanthomonadaceae bacterium]